MLLDTRPGILKLGKGLGNVPGSQQATAGLEGGLLWRGAPGENSRQTERSQKVDRLVDGFLRGAHMWLW